MRYCSIIIVIVCLSILVPLAMPKKAACERIGMSDSDMRYYDKQVPDPQAAWESEKLAYDFGRIFKYVLIGIVVIFVIGWCIGKF